MLLFQAKNIVNYLRIIHRILAPGGVWINLGKHYFMRIVYKSGCLTHHLSIGPLLWHWEGNTSNDPSIELTLDEVKALARKIGFEISVSPSQWPPTPPIYPFSRLDLRTCVT